MSKERATEPTPIAEKKQAAEPSRRSDMTSEQAAAMILAPYVTEKTFNQIEKDNGARKPLSSSRPQKEQEILQQSWLWYRGAILFSLDLKVALESRDRVI